MGVERRGGAAFELHYAQAFGQRWPELSRCLTKDKTRTVRANGFANAEQERELFSTLEPAEVTGCYQFEDGRQLLARDSAGLRLGYVMDLASVQCARSLPLQGAAQVLDLCAAPGGKSLILAEALESNATLTCNDRSPARRERLKVTLADYLPRELRERVRVTGLDGRRFGMRHQEQFDAVLLDAPCSSESHVLKDPAALAKWSPNRVKQLARDQYALLTSALLALRPGGYLVYSTCALLPEENDGVVGRLLERGRHPAEVRQLELAGAEATTFGQQFLPDTSGRGPLYVCLLQKGKALPTGKSESASSPTWGIPG